VSARDDAMDLTRLAYFVAPAEELHLGRAASRLAIAQPPLSRQIAQLETDLGVMLIDRSRSQIRLTQAGTVLLERAREVLERLDRTEREIKRIGEGFSGHLRVAFVSSATYGVLPNVIKTFRSTYPDVELALSAMNNVELKRAVIQREIDIAVARPSLDDEELKPEPLLHEPLILALPEAFALLQERPIQLACLKSETFILYPRKPRPSFADHILKICLDEQSRERTLSIEHAREKPIAAEYSNDRRQRIDQGGRSHRFRSIDSHEPVQNDQRRNDD
jgi:LysR family transcriptional regulator, benzoate and cis,cis-muconate-responsive activator of ben and cat genes